MPGLISEGIALWVGPKAVVQDIEETIATGATDSSFIDREPKNKSRS